MAQIKIVGKISITDESGDTKDIPLFDSYTSVTKLEEKTFALTADTTATVWDPNSWTGYQPSSFDYLVMIADGDLDVELTTEASSAAYPNSFRLKENTPFILGADDSYDGSDTSSAFGGTLSTINKIRVDEPNSAAVNLRLILID